MDLSKSIKILEEYTAQLRLTRHEQTTIMTALEVVRMSALQLEAFKKAQQAQQEAAKQPIDNQDKSQA